MVFAQEIQYDQMVALQEAYKICTEHSECKKCPLLARDIQTKSATVRCETGRLKNKNEGEKSYEKNEQN